MRRIAIAVAAFVLLIAQAPAELSYRFEDVTGKVLLDHNERAAKVRPGDLGRGGDIVRTGWLGRATVSVDRAASQFEIYPGSRVVLASDHPGVLVKLENGKLKALFDALTGNDERLVETPGALLAVRGTRYGLEVDKTGRSRLMVFEGAVEVRPFDPAVQPALVRAREMCEIRRGEQIRRQPIPAHMNENSWERRGAGQPPDRRQGPDGRMSPGTSPAPRTQGKPDPPGRPH